MPAFWGKCRLAFLHISQAEWRVLGVKLSSFFLDDSHRNTIFFPRENVSFWALNKVFPDESHRNAQHFFAFSWKKNVKFVFKIFSGWLRPLNPPNCCCFQLPRCMQDFPNREIFPNRGKRGVLFDVQTEEWSKPRKVYICIFATIKKTFFAYHIKKRFSFDIPMHISWFEQQKAFEIILQIVLFMIRHEKMMHQKHALLS